jgi:hypothetical protein
MSGTPLQEVYTIFISKVDEDLTGKESLIFNYLQSAKSKAYKYTSHSLDFILSDPISPATISYDGYFNNILNQDEIELIALYMLYEHLSRQEKYWVSLRELISTKDFNSMPDKKRILDGIQNSKKILKEEIDDFKQQFFDYKYN